ncbi:MAG: hypothetical protein LBF22_04385 [Deltaproteobacteria bacterium]|nr:hypothetical protein [Deltaproteobacteria bacterium]
MAKNIILSNRREAVRTGWWCWRGQGRALPFNRLPPETCLWARFWVVGKERVRVKMD